MDKQRTMRQYLEYTIDVRSHTHPNGRTLDYALIYRDGELQGITQADSELEDISLKYKLKIHDLLCK